MILQSQSQKTTIALVVQHKRELKVGSLYIKVLKCAVGNLLELFPRFNTFYYDP